MPSQYALKLPATRPERIFSDGPPSRDDVTTSRTWRDSVEVNTFTSSGMSAPASVPQRDDRGQLPPQLKNRRRSSGIMSVRNDVGDHDRNDRSQPHQDRQRRLIVHLVGVQVLRLRDRAVDEVAQRRSDHHHDAHREDPDQQLDLHQFVCDGEEDEGNQCDAGHAVGFKAVGRRSDGVACVVAGAVCDHAGVARVVFLDLEDDLHQVRADIGNLRENSARHAQSRRAQRLSDRETDETRIRQFTGHEQKHAQHQQSSTLISSMPMLIPACKGMS